MTEEIFKIDDLDDSYKGNWIELDENELIDMFADLIESSTKSLGPEYDFNLCPKEYFEEKFPGLPPEAYDILASGNYSTEPEMLGDAIIE
jgi:hypothetical protein